MLATGLATLDLEQAVELLRQGQVLAYPTEAVFGLGCDPWNEQAVTRLLQLKSRQPEQGLILIASHWQQPGEQLVKLSEAQRQSLTADQRRHTTWVVPASDRAPRWITGKHPSIAIRVSDHPVCQSLCQAFGAPLVSTSANPSGQAPARDRQTLEEYFAGQLPGVVAGELGGFDQPSQIRDLASGAVLRA